MPALLPDVLFWLAQQRANTTVVCASAFSTAGSGETHSRRVEAGTAAVRHPAAVPVHSTYDETEKQR